MDNSLQRNVPNNVHKTLEDRRKESFMKWTVTAITEEEGYVNI